MPNQHSTWVLVADSSQARIYRIVKFPHIEEIAYLEHQESRLHNQDLVSAKPGRNFQRGGTTRHAYEPETDPKQAEAVKFAIHLSNHLNLAETQREFSRLYVFAESSFLGLLRQHIHAETKKTIVSEVPKELIPCNKEAIEQQLANLEPVFKME
jgi:protein required for attachment to host cells